MKATSTKAEACRACGTALPGEALLDLGMQPLANNLCSEEQHNDDVYPLRVVRCDSCGLLQLDTVVDPAAMFSHYLYTPSQSRKTLVHFEELAARTVQRLNPGNLAVDIGSNDGALLGFLRTWGWRVAGVDPAANLVAEANAKGLPTVCRFFDDAAVDEVLAAHGQALLITANNVFAHTPDWQRFMRCVERLLAPGGLLAVEFPYGPVMLRDGTLDLVYFEHVSFPAIGPLDALLDPFAFDIVDVDELPDIHGGSVRVWIGRRGEHEDVRQEHGEFVDRLRREEQIRSYSAIACERFAFRAMLARENLVDVVREERRRGRRVVGYTAPAKAVTMIEFCGLTKDDVACVVDDNVLKQNKLLPHSHIPVVSPREAKLFPGDVVVIFAWNVADDIMARFPDGMDVVVPMPRVRVVRR